MSKDIDEMMRENNDDFASTDGLTIVKHLNDMYPASDGLVAKSVDDEAEDIFDEDEDSIESRKRKAKAKILLEKKEIRNKYPNSNQYLNKKKRG